MRLLRWVCCLACVWPSGLLAAQTYNPRQIRFEGGGDPAELLRLSGLQSGTPLTKAQIEAAMAKLAETGAFTDLSYTVSQDALVIKLGGAETSRQALPVRYSNLVWWPADELTRLLEQQVPLFHGQLPLTGNLTDHVCDVLVQMLAEKGVPNARVEAMPSTLGASTGKENAAAAPDKARPGTAVSAIALRILKPEITLGHVAISGAAASTQTQLAAVTGMLAMQEFDTAASRRAIHDNISDTQKNAGFLDATVDEPIFSAPHEDMTGYVVDASVAVHAGELFRLGVLQLGTTEPLTEAEALQAVDLKTGQPAGAMAMNTSPGALQRAYVSRGRLDAEIKLRSTIDRANHIVAMNFTIQPGELYHLAGIDTTALPAAMQADFAREFRGKAGMDAGLPLGAEVGRALAAINASRSVRAGMRSNRAAHTVTVVLEPAGAKAARPAGE